MIVTNSYCLFSCGLVLMPYISEPASPSSHHLAPTPPFINPSAYTLIRFHLFAARSFCVYSSISPAVHILLLSELPLLSHPWLCFYEEPAIFECSPCLDHTWYNYNKYWRPVNITELLCRNKEVNLMNLMLDPQKSQTPALNASKTFSSKHFCSFSILIVGFCILHFATYTAWLFFFAPSV